MAGELDRAEIRPPRPEEWPAVCDLLARVFPIEDWLWSEVASQRACLCRWQSLCMFLDGEVLGHVGRMDIPIWLGGWVMTVAGVASVATAPEWRRHGVAGALLRRLMEGVDRDALCAALFTGVPKVYEKCGFRTVPQEYRAAPASAMPEPRADVSVEEIARLDSQVLARLDRIYSIEYPDHDGKVARDSDYWRWYALLFNNSRGKRILVCRRGRTDIGYVRIEEEPGQLLVSELCSSERDPESIEALVSVAGLAARDRGLGEMHFALPPSHGLWRVMKGLGVPFSSPTVPRREIFMVRGTRASGPCALDGILWSLADKF